MTTVSEPVKSIPFYLKQIEKPSSQTIVQLLAIGSLFVIAVIMLALGVFQFFYAERASQYFGLTEFEYLHFFKWTFTQAQLPAFGVAGGLIVISLLNAFRYESYYTKHSRQVITKENNPFLYNLNRFLPIEWTLNILRGFLGYVPNDVTWIPKILFALIEGYFIYVALSVEKAGNPVVHQLGLMVAIGLPVLSYITSHGFSWLFFYVFDYNGYKSKLLNDDNADLQKKNAEMKDMVKALEKQHADLQAAIDKANNQLDDSLETLGRTDDEVDILKQQKADLLQQVGSITNGNLPFEQENHIRHLQDENNNLKETIEMNLRYIETALSNTREKLGLYGSETAAATEKSYEINDRDFDEAEREINGARFVSAGKQKIGRR